MSALTPMILIASHHSKKFVRCWLESSKGSRPNCVFVCTNLIVVAFNSKLFTVNSVLTITDRYSSALGFYSPRTFLFHPYSRFLECLFLLLQLIAFLRSLQSSLIFCTSRRIFESVFSISGSKGTLSKLMWLSNFFIFYFFLFLFVSFLFGQIDLM